MGLTESFGQARSQILLMSPIPAVNQAYVMIVSDECQNVTSSRSSIGLSSMSGSGVDPLAMYSRTVGGSSAQGFNKCKGHTKDQCYKLIEYPTDFKSKRKVSTSTGNGAYMVGNEFNNTRKDGYENVSDELSFNYGSNTNVSVKNHMSNIKECTNQLQGCNFTKDQYNQILQMLKQNQGCESKSEDTTHAHETQANTADMLTDESVVKMKEPKLVYWLLGKCHMCLILGYATYLQKELYTGKVREVGKDDNGLYLLLKNLTQDQLKH
ncbi:hypothetical protein KY289_020992 [Solanum tuberosum]|nr:hypothetical protein KY289_020992 [Solanum tuberosum]